MHQLKFILLEEISRAGSKSGGPPKAVKDGSLTPLFGVGAVDLR